MKKIYKKHLVLSGLIKKLLTNNFVDIWTRVVISILIVFIVYCTTIVFIWLLSIYTHFSDIISRKSTLHDTRKGTVIAAHDKAIENMDLSSQQLENCAHLLCARFVICHLIYYVPGSSSVTSFTMYQVYPLLPHLLRQVYHLLPHLLWAKLSFITATSFTICQVCHLLTKLSFLCKLRKRGTNSKFYTGKHLFYNNCPIRWFASVSLKF